jgi:hypothetical protein
MSKPTFDIGSRVVCGHPSDKENAHFGKVVNSPAANKYVVQWDEMYDYDDQLTVVDASNLTSEADFKNGVSTIEADFKNGVSTIEADFIKLQADVSAKLTAANTAMKEAQASLAAFYGEEPIPDTDRYNSRKLKEMGCSIDEMREKLLWVEKQYDPLLSTTRNLGYYLGWSSSSFAC